ncbi:MAG: hypothetical protein ACFE9R_15530, partial [Candidatus Hermodarchaeota archaeon]
VQEVIDVLVTLVRGLTEDAIEDAIEMVGEDNHFVVIAIEKYDIALQKLIYNKFDKAVEYFRIAYKYAMKARVEWVPEFFIDDLQGLIADIQELKEEEDISYIAWNYLNYAECKIQDAINMANQSIFDIAFYKLGIAIYFLTRAYSYGVDTLFLIDDIMGMIDELVELKISDAESVLIGAESELIETAWTIFHNAQEALENGDYNTAIQLYIQALEKAEDALLPEWYDYDYHDHDYHC